MNEFLHALLGSPAHNLITLVLLLLAATGTGALLRRRLLGVGSRRADFRLDTVLGINVLALTGLLAAPLLLTASPWLPGGILAVPAAYGLLQLRADRTLQAGRLAWVLLALWGGITLGSALFPPYAWDEQTYQVAVLASWLQSGSTAPLPDNPYSAFPLLFQFFALWGVKIAGIGVARLLIWAFYLLLFALLYGEVRRYLRNWEALALTGIFVLSPLVVTMTREVYVEPLIALDLLAIFRLRRLSGYESRRGMLAGILAGGALAVKLTALAAAGIIAGQGGRLRRFRHWGVATLAGAAIFGGVFYGRSWLTLGNPVYPFGSAIFGGGENAAAVERYHLLMGSFYYGISGWYNIVFGWLAASFNEALFDGIVMGWSFAAMFVLALGGSYLVGRRRGKLPASIRILLLTFAILYGWWAFTSAQTRFLLPGYAVLVILAAAVLRQFSHRVRYGAIGVLLALWCVNPEVQGLLHFQRCWQLCKQAQTEPQRWLGIAGRDPEYFRMLEFIDRETPRNARVLLVFERRVSICRERTGTVRPAFNRGYLHRCRIPRKRSSRTCEKKGSTIC